MTRRKVFIAFAAAVMILVLTAALFVACDQTKTYTVTFKDGETVVKTVSVKDGATIADADLPADPTKDSAVFEGWFDGDKAFDKTAAITGDVTYTAKWTSLFTVTFKDGDTVIATATVKDGEKIAASDIPANLADTQDAAFEGWFNGDNAFDKDAAITASVTYNAKWTGLFNVTFMNGDTQVKSVKVKDGAVISAEDVPGALADTDFAFLGWFVGDVAYDSSAAVTSNIVVNAKFSTFFKSYIGTWHGATSDWDPIAYTVVVDANSISVTIGNAAAQVATGVAVDADGSVMFKLGETDYMLYQDYDGSLKIFESSDVKLSKELAGRVHVSSSDIVGTYTTEGGHTIVINKTFAKVDGVLGTGFYYNVSSGYSWSIGDNYSSLAYDSSAQAWIYKEGTSSAADKLIVPELVAIDIPAEFIGNWYGTFESFGSTSYFLVKVTADGVFAYTPGSGFAKVGVATEYKDGKLTVVGLDETITASIADGKLAYKSDAAYGADYQLEKGTVVVFENNYSVFYVAKLGADNKIDQSTFALEDPQMKAGYTFKGWAGDLDGAEFDESATFADSAVFVGSSEKTGYVVTFKKTSSDSDPVIAVVEMTNGKLAADQIPAALTYEDGSVFAGWYTSAGVKATADLAITADTTFIAKSVKESDYAGAWVSTEAGKEITLLVADGKLTFGEIVNVAYTFNEDGSISYGKNRDNSAKYSVVLTVDGIKATYRHLDSMNEDYEEDVYTLTALKAISGVAGSYKSDNAHRFVIAENGLVTTAANTDNVFMGYVTGSSKSNFTIVYKTSSSIKSQTVKGARIDAKGNLVLGKITADAEILIKDLKGFKSYYMADEGTLYVYTNSDDTITYVFKTSSDKYAYVKAEDITGTVAEGEIFTITYGLYNGTYKKTNTTQTYKIVNGKLTTAGAEKGEYTAEGKDALTLNGFGDATLGEKSYKYSINAKNVVVLTGEATLGVTLDSKAKTYAEVASDGFVHTYIDASNDKYTMVFDGFGGATLTSVSSYSSSVYIYSGTYTLGTGTVTVAKTSYSYNKTYTIEESGNVLVSTDGKKVLKVAGYVVENKVEQFNGYYVNGDGNIEISVAKDKTVTILLNGVAVKKVSVNWNGTVLTFDADDYDAPKEGWTSEFTIVKDGDNVKLSHACKQSYDSIYEEFETIQKDIVFTKSTKPSAETDGLEGTYKSGSNVIVLDGKGNGTLNGNAFTYSGTGSTKQVSAFGAFNGSANTFTVTATGIDVSFDDEYYENTFKASFTKEAAETLDAFAGTWTYGSFVLTFDGKGNGTFNNGTEFKFTYTVSGNVANISNFGAFDGGQNKATLSSDGSSVALKIADSYDETSMSQTFTKQA
ncbi:MAG: InlB B-repeat-containing protein [Christensenella sp.]|nr:MAG: InlB B-repeat-containing protein [Christensenella sp.]